MSLKRQWDRQDAFLKFCLEQGPGRRIDHCGGWSQCAVGDYAREGLGLNPYHVDYGAFPRDHVPRVLREKLDTAGAMDETYLRTYGDLQDLIAELYPRHYERLIGELTS